MNTTPQIERWPASAAGRSRLVAFGDMVFAVANARDEHADLDTQISETFALLDAALAEGGSERTRMLSVHVLLSDMAHKSRFDARWAEWFGPDPQAWPQRACYAAALAGGLMVELVVQAARFPRS